MRQYLITFLIFVSMLAPIYSVSSGTSTRLTVNDGGDGLAINVASGTLIRGRVQGNEHAKLFSNGYMIYTNATLVTHVTMIGGKYAIKGLNPVRYTNEIVEAMYDYMLMPNPFDYLNLSEDIPWLLSEQPVFEVVYDPKSGKNISVWTIHLRDDIYFTDGVQLTADDVVFTYEFISWINSEGAPAAYSGAVSNVENATKVDNFTVKIFMKVEGYLISRYALDIIIYPKHIYEIEDTWGWSDDDDYDIFPNWNITADNVSEYEVNVPNDPILICYGPFKLIGWTPQDLPPINATEFTLERNPNYFMRAVDEEGNILVPWSPITKDNIDLHGPYVKYLKYRVIHSQDPAEVYDALVNGEMDLASDIMITEYIDDFEQQNMTVVGVVRLGYGHTLINTEGEGPEINGTSIFNFSQFRRAIAFAYDKWRICNDVWYGHAVPVDVPDAKCSIWSIENPEVDLAPYTYAYYNKEKALAELEKIGIRDIDDDGWLEINSSDPDSEINVTILGTAMDIVEQIVEILAQDLEAVGIHATTEYVSWSELQNRVFYSRDYQIAFFGFSSDRYGYFLDYFRSGQWVSYVAGWSNSTYDDYVMNMLYYCETVDFAKQYAWDAELILFEEQPMIPIYNNIIHGVYRSAEVFPDGVMGVVEEVPGFPVKNKYTLLRAIKVFNPIQILSPQNNSVIANATELAYDVYINESNIANISLSINDTTIAIWVPENITEHPITYSLYFEEGGKYEIRVALTTVDGSVYTDSAVVIVDVEPPIIDISSLQNNTYVCGTIYVNYSLADISGIELAKLLINNTMLEAVYSTGDYSYELDTTIYEDGIYEIKVVASDKFGYYSSHKVYIYICNNPPILYIDSPQNNTYFNTTNITVSWHAHGIGINNYEVRLDDGDWTDVGNQTTYTFQGLGEGLHKLYVAVNDKAEHRG